MKPILIVCPKCNHVRQGNETVPDWQCPSCGVAYSKVAHLARGSTPPVEQGAKRTGYEKSAFPWLTWVLVLVLGFAAWAGAKTAFNRVSSSAEGGGSIEVVRKLASTVGRDEVIVYCVPECGYCTQAKAWLNQNGFAFTDCNMRADRQCEREYINYGGTGTPYLVVRGKHMKNGFDSDEFLTILRNSR